VITPVLLSLTLIALNWATKVILTRDATFLVILLFLTNIVLMAYFQAARPDHHGLMVFLFVLSVGLVLRLVLVPFKYSLCYTAGVIGALSVWVSVESMMPVCLSLGVLGLLWVMQGGDFLKKNLYFSISLFVFSEAVMLIERPLTGLKTIEFDCFSIVHVCLLALVAVFWTTGSILNNRSSLLMSRAGRGVYCVLGGGAIALSMWLLFPRVYGGPMVDVDPRIIPIWLAHINEVQSLIRSPKHICMAAQLIGAAVVSFAFLVYLLLKNTEKAKRNGWLYIAILAVAFVSIALYQVRWAVYANTILSIVMAELLCRILQWRKDRGNKLVLAVRNGFVTLVFAFGFLYLGMVIKTLVRNDQLKESTKKVSLIPMCRYLSEQGPEGGQPLRIVTHMSYAGEILYRTPHEVLGSNYHRNGPGIMDSYNIMMAQTDDQALEIIRQRGLDIVLICPNAMEDIFRPRDENTSTFYQRLQEKPPPKGLKRVHLPEDLSDDFLLFEIDL
jgi:hypothetical protein